VWGPSSLLPPPNAEGVAWQARIDAEVQRARWAAGQDVTHDSLVDAWRGVADRFDRYGEPYEAARARARLAEVLLAAGDRDADEVLAAARTVALGLRATPFLAVLDRLAPHPGARTDLTPREAEVLALVAEGRSNGEIGRALFISTKTASVHVSNILAKLGAASRGEAVALARASGLLDD
jgi:DNA-binding CsgD family transcriptional regulator